MLHVSDYSDQATDWKIEEMWFDLRKEQQTILPPKVLTDFSISLPNSAYSERAVDLSPKHKRLEREAKGSEPSSV